MVRGAQPVLKPLLLVVYACFTLSVARERGQHDESEVASEFEAKRNKLGLRSKLALPIAGQPRVARSLGGKLGQLQSAITLRPNSRTLEETSNQKLREPIAAGDSKERGKLGDEMQAAPSPSTPMLPARSFGFEDATPSDVGLDLVEIESGSGAALATWAGAGQAVWNAMLANAQVGRMAQGRLLVEPNLKTSSSEVVRAALRGDVEGLRTALGDGQGALESRTAHAGETPLMLAAISGNPDAAGLLLARGADPNARDLQGWTALMKAVALENPTMVALLLASGADSEVRNNAGATALTIATAWRKRDIAKMLLDARSRAAHGYLVSTDDAGLLATNMTRLIANDPAGVALGRSLPSERALLEELEQLRRRCASLEDERERWAKDWVMWVVRRSEGQREQYGIIKGLEARLRESESEAARLRTALADGGSHEDRCADSRLDQRLQESVAALQKTGHGLDTVLRDLKVELRKLREGDAGKCKGAGDGLVSSATRDVVQSGKSDSEITRDEVRAQKGIWERPTQCERGSMSVEVLTGDVEVVGVCVDVSDTASSDAGRERRHAELEVSEFRGGHALAQGNPHALEGGTKSLGNSGTKCEGGTGDRGEDWKELGMDELLEPPEATPLVHANHEAISGHTVRFALRNGLQSQMEDAAQFQDQISLRGGEGTTDTDSSERVGRPLLRLRGYTDKASFDREPTATNANGQGVGITTRFGLLLKRCTPVSLGWLREALINAKERARKLLGIF